MTQRTWSARHGFGVNLLDEHVVAELHRDDPDFDGRFLEAMSTARQRQSVFEAEES